MSFGLRRIASTWVALGLVAACASSALKSTENDGDEGEVLTGAAGDGGAAGEAGAGSELGCTRGTERCDCLPDGSCDDNLLCLSYLCVDASSLCLSAGDGICDEPQRCPPGTDPDCCAAPKNGVCDEPSGGGLCAEGSDYFDCGYCLPSFVEDGFCDEPNVCPPGSDDADCCAHPKDGECEEVGRGGECEEGSDFFDCGYCPELWLADGLCDEPDFCPEGTDGADCCSHFADGECEETSMGGECAEDSDWFDCGYCPDQWLGDGFCDEQQFGGSCPPNTDPEDCCATWGDEMCEEPSGDGECPVLSDFLDCGYCPTDWINDGYCAEVRVGGPCPEGSDGGDCCATLRDSVCEEESMGGMCPDKSDWYDCGYCPELWVNDGRCHETPFKWGCPEGSDGDDCDY